MAAKQSVPADVVKRRDGAWAYRGLIFVGLASLALTACADTAWRNPAKSAQQLRADLSACEREAEKSSLASSGTNRNDYAVANSGLAVPGSKGASPLDLKDKSDLSKSYNIAVQRCMRAKSYMQGHAADQHK